MWIYRRVPILLLLAVKIVLILPKFKKSPDRRVERRLEGHKRPEVDVTGRREKKKVLGERIRQMTRTLQEGGWGSGQLGVEFLKGFPSSKMVYESVVVSWEERSRTEFRHSNVNRHSTNSRTVRGGGLSFMVFLPQYSQKGELYRVLNHVETPICHSKRKTKYKISVPE